VPALASRRFFPYAHSVKKPSILIWRNLQRPVLLAFVFLLAGEGFALKANVQEKASESAPAVTKVEPPNWWVGLTPDVMLLLSGHDLEATHVSCNLPTLTVSRTQSAAGGGLSFCVAKDREGHEVGDGSLPDYGAKGSDFVRIATGGTHADTGKISGALAG